MEMHTALPNVDTSISDLELHIHRGYLQQPQAHGNCEQGLFWGDNAGLCRGFVFFFLNGKQQGQAWLSELYTLHCIKNNKGEQVGVILRITKNGAEPALQPALKTQCSESNSGGRLRSLCTPLLLFNHF